MKIFFKKLKIINNFSLNYFLFNNFKYKNFRNETFLAIKFFAKQAPFRTFYIKKIEQIKNNKNQSGNILGTGLLLSNLHPAQCNKATAGTIGPLFNASILL